MRRQKSGPSFSSFSSVRKSRSGFVFTLDALLAALFLIAGLVLISKVAERTSDTTQLSTVSEDTLSSLSAIRIGDLNDPWVQANLANGTIADSNISVLEQIGFFWATNQPAQAQQLAGTLMTQQYPKLGVNLSIGGVQVYERDSLTGSKDIITSSRMISGIAQGQAITGSSASAYLRHIKNKRDSLFLPFGGFVGEGNITLQTTALPSDANVTDIIIELDTDQPFNFLINNKSCDYLMPVATPLVPTSWNRTNCTSLVNPAGINTFSFNSRGVLNGSAIYGGFVSLLYSTNQFNNFNVTPTVYQFPRIDGLINLYDGLYVGGSINSMNMTLHFLSNYTSYLTIGNASFTFGGSNATQNITLNDTQIQNALTTAGLSYAMLSRTTVPLRFGIGNVVINGAVSDNVVVSDVSGSMGECITTSATPPPACPVGDTTKIISSKNVTGIFVSTLLNNTNTRVGLAAFSTGIVSWNNLTSNATPLLTQIGTYAPSSTTCVCCGVNNATNSLLADGQVTLIARGSSGWKYNDTKLASPPAGWNTSGYNDAGWKSGTTNMGWGYAGQSTTFASQYKGDYYERKYFNVTDASAIYDADLYVDSDDGADVYINGIRVDNNYPTQIATGIYWNRNAISVNKTVFVTGQNVIAVKQYSRQNPNKMSFDLQLIANTKGNVTSTQRKNIIVMTDGIANVDCPADQGTGDPIQDAIKAACDAYNKYGIIVYTVGFGRDADNATLKAMANCTTGQFYSAGNNSALFAAFSAIGSTIIQQSSTQTAIVSGNVSQTILYADSVINANYTPDVIPPAPNEISVTLKSPPLGACTANVALYPGMRFLDARLNSYTGDDWTSYVGVNGVKVYNLSTYASVFASVGDPYQIVIPPVDLASGNVTFNDFIGIDATNFSASCSPNNTLVYTASINLSTERSVVVPNATGCKWTVAFEDGSVLNMTIPTTYAGSKSCSYQPGNFSYDANDAYQLGAYTIFNRLDFRKTGKLFVDLSSDDLEVIVTTVSKVPYLWGPSTVTLQVAR